MTRIPPWTYLPCASCGVEGLATRRKPREGPYICTECEMYSRGFADGRRTAHAKVEGLERRCADLGRELARVRQALWSEGCKVDGVLLRGAK